MLNLLVISLVPIEVSNTIDGPGQVQDDHSPGDERHHQRGPEGLVPQDHGDNGRQD